MGLAAADTYDAVSSRPCCVAAPISEVAASEGLEALTPERIGYEVMERLRTTDTAEALMRRRTWPRNILFDQGHQRLSWSSGAMSWTAARQHRDKTYKEQQANLLGTRGDHWVADLSQGLPSFAGIPENKDLESRRVAKLGERLVMSDWRKCNLDQARSLALRDIWRCGVGFIEAYWDSEAGPIKPEYDPLDAADGRPAINALGRPIYKQKPDGTRKVKGYKHEGAVTARSVSPFLVYVPTTTDAPVFESAEWVIRLEWATPHEIRGMAHEELPEDFSFTTDERFRYVDSLLNSPERNASSTEAHGLCLVVHYYQLRKAVEGFTRGKHYIVVSEQSIADEDLQGFGECQGESYPIFAFSGRPRARTFWSQPEIQDRISTQRRRNSRLTHEMEMLKRFSMPLTYAYKNSEVPDRLPWDGSTVMVNPAYQPPGVIQIPSPPPGLLIGKDGDVAEIDMIGGDEPVSRGVAVSAPSALYVQHLQDAAGKRVGPMVRQHAHSWARLGEHLCQLHASNEKDEQIIQTIGRRNRPELVALRTADVGYVRFVVSESSLSGSMPSARIAQLQTVIPTVFGGPPYPPAAQRAFLNFVRMPDMLDLESGTSGLDDWVENAVSRLIDEASDPGIDPESLEPDELQAMLDGLKQRQYAGDYWDWDQATKRRFAEFRGALQQVASGQAEQEAAAADEEMQKGVAAQVGVEEGKAEAKTAGGIRLAYAKQRAEALRSMVQPPQAPGQEDEAPAAEQEE